MDDIRPLSPLVTLILTYLMCQCGCEGSQVQQLPVLQERPVHVQPGQTLTRRSTQTPSYRRTESPLTFTSRAPNRETPYSPGSQASTELSDGEFVRDLMSYDEEWRGDIGAQEEITEQLLNCSRPEYIADVAQFFLLGDSWVELNQTDLQIFPRHTNLVYQCRQPGSEVIEGTDWVIDCQSGRWTDEPPTACHRMGREIVIGGSTHFPQRVEHDGNLTVFLPPLTSALRLEVTCQMRRLHQPDLQFSHITLEEGRASLFPERGDTALSKLNLTLSPPEEADSGRFTCRDTKGINSHALTINFRVRDVKPIHACPEAIIYKSTEAGLNSTLVYWEVPQLPAESTAEITSSFNSGGRFEIGVTMVTVSVTDEHGTLTVCEFAIHVNDTEPPHIEDCPQDMYLPTEDNENYRNVSWKEPSSTDNSGSASLEMVSDYERGSKFPIGRTNVTYIARDEAGNDNVCTFTITVRDMQPPNIGCPSSQRLVLGNDQGTAIVDWPEPDVTDNSGGDVSITPSGAARGLRYSPGEHHVTYTAEDSAGNVARCDFQIDIIDEQPPVLINCPYNKRVFIDPTVRESVSVTWGMPTADDNAGQVDFISSHNSGDTFHVGRHVITIVAMDASRNEAECKFFIRVVEGKCRSIQNQNLTWDESYPGIIPSRQKCPLMTEHAGQPLAHLTCRLRTTIGAMWLPTPVETICGVTRNNITLQEIREYVPIDKYTAGDVATALLDVVTRKNTTYGRHDLVAIADIIDDIVSANAPSQEVLQSILTTIEMVFLAESEMSTDGGGDHVSERLIRALERQVSAMSAFSMELTTETKSIVVRITTVNATASSEKFEFEIEGLNGATFGTDESVPVVKLPLREISSRITEGDQTEDQTTDLLHLAFIFYRNPILFTMAETASGSREPGLKGEVTGGVVSASVSNTSVKDLRYMVEIVFPLDPAENLSQYPATCVYWDFEAQNGGGGWSNEGVRLVEQTDAFIVCESDHLTHFAVLMDFSGRGEDVDPLLDLLTKIGCALSIAGLSATILTFVAFRTLRDSRHRQILINHCTSLLLLYVVFLVGIDSTNIFCMAAAILLHYLMLTTMFWMAIEAHNMYMYLVKVFQRDVRRFILKASIFAWGVPMLITAASVSIAQKDYRHTDYCFPAPGINLYLSLLLPMALVMLHNFVIFSVVVCRLVCTDVAGKAITQSRKQQLLSRLQNAMCMSVLMGLSWSLGFLAAVQPSFFFQLLFCLANSLQGLAVFILFCLRVSDVRTAYKTCMPWLNVELNIRGQSYKVQERPVHQYHSRHSKDDDPMWLGSPDRVSSALSWPSDTPGLEAYMHLPRQLSGTITDSTRVTGTSGYSIHRSNSLFSRWT